MVPRQPASISAYAFPTPSPSPPWDRGSNLQPYITTAPPEATAALLTPSQSPGTMAQMVNHGGQVMIMPTANPNAKDSRWLTLEVCREFQRSKCSRTDNECKFAHPPPHVEVQNGRVVACFDSIKGKCQRKDPPCKYLHPPQHLREQLLQNGRNNLILKNLQLQAYQQAQYTGVLPMTHYPGLPTLPAVPAQAPTASYSPYITTSLASVAVPSGGDPTPIMSQALPHMIPATAKAVRADKFEQSSMPGMVPAYKRIAVDINKGGIPVYQTNPLVSPLQHTSLMQFQQPPSYIPMSFAGCPPSMPRF